MLINFKRRFFINNKNVGHIIDSKSNNSIGVSGDVRGNSGGNINGKLPSSLNIDVSDNN